MVRAGPASRVIGRWRGVGQLVIDGASVGRVEYSIEAREDRRGVRTGGGYLTGDDAVIAQAFGRSGAEILIESGDRLGIDVTEVRGKFQKSGGALSLMRQLREWR